MYFSDEPSVSTSDPSFDERGRFRSGYLGRISVQHRDRDLRILGLRHNGRDKRDRYGYKFNDWLQISWLLLALFAWFAWPSQTQASSLLMQGYGVDGVAAGGCSNSLVYSAACNSQYLSMVGIP
jgi:hypothetical protein